MISVKNTFGENIESIYSDPKYQNLVNKERGFHVIDNIPLNSLLFIGLNPSFSNGFNFEKVEFYNLMQVDNTYKRYFGKFEEMAVKVGLLWGHFDLLYFRETNQSLVESLQSNDIGLSYICDQLTISKMVLEASKPKILVVCNSKSRELLGKDKSWNSRKKKHEKVWLNYDFAFDEAIGTYRILNNDSNLFQVPVFFSSMLSGQRALDNGSYERLVWQVKRANEML